MGQDNHWPPKLEDMVYDSDRADVGRNPYGRVVRVLRQDEEVLVRYNGASISHAVGLIRVDGIAYPSVISCLNPDWILPGGDIKTFSFDELDGCWESSDGGRGCWVLSD